MDRESRKVAASKDDLYDSFYGRDDNFIMIGIQYNRTGHTERIQIMVKQNCL